MHISPIRPVAENAVYQSPVIPCMQAFMGSAAGEEPIEVVVDAHLTYQDCERMRCTGSLATSFCLQCLPERLSNIIEAAQRKVERGAKDRGVCAEHRARVANDVQDRIIEVIAATEMQAVRRCLPEPGKIQVPKPDRLDRLMLGAA